MRRGHTLAEVLVAGSLGLLVLGLCVSGWMLGRRVFSQARQHQDIQQSTLTACVRMRQDYLAARPESLRVTTETDRVLVSFLSYEGTGGQDPAWGPTGDILWRKWVQFRFQPETGELRRREVALPAPTSSPASEPPAWDGSPLGNLVAHSLQEFTVAPHAVLLDVRLRTQLETARSDQRLAVFPRLYGLD